MSTRILRKVAVASTDIGNQKTVRFDRVNFAYGTIPAASYTAGDLLVFNTIDAKDIVDVRLVPTGGTAVSVYNNADFTQPIRLAVGTVASDIVYRVDFIRGTGKKLSIQTVASAS